MTQQMDLLPSGVLTLDKEGSIVAVNRFLRDLLGLGDSPVADISMQRLMPVSTRIFMQTHVMPMLRMQGRVDEIFIKLYQPDGSRIPVLLNGWRIDGEGDSGQFICSLMPMRLRHEYEDQILLLKQQADRDALEKARLNAELVDAKRGLEQKQTELLEAVSELKRLATTDPLTSLKNKRAFEEDLSAQIALALRQETSLSLLIIDADHFKTINDRYGHPEGDRYLVHFARLLRSLLRESDSAARYGGEEFAVLLPDTDVHGAALVAEKIRGVVERANWDRDAITVSIGAATLPDDATSSERLLLLADRALYISKHEGRNRVTLASQSRALDESPSH